MSGSKDCSCIVWDLARLSFVRQLVPHSSPIDAVGVNELTGDIATCSSSWLHLWSVNGELIGRMDTAGVGGGSGGGVNHGILCVGFSILNEWDSDNVVMTGSMDGIVRMWSIRYVQVPEFGKGSKKRGGLLATKSSEETEGEDDSSLVTEDSEAEAVTEMGPLEEEDVPGKDSLAVEVLDPDKDRDSLEDVHAAVKEGGEVVKIVEASSSTEQAVSSQESPPVVIRRQRRDRLNSSGERQSPGYEECLQFCLQILIELKFEI